MRVHVGRRAKRLENAATAAQTHARRRGGAPCEQPARAAASCRRRDLVRLLTAGKTEFVKSEPPLMRKNTYMSQHSEPANQKKKPRPALGTKTAPEQQGGAGTGVCTQTAELGAVQGRVHAHAHSGGVLDCVWLACVHICVCPCAFPSGPLSAFSLLGPARHVCICACVCVCVSLQRVRFPTHHKTQNAMTNKSLISSFLPQQHKAQPNPCANTPSAGRERRRRRPTCGVFVFGREGRRRRRRTARGGWI